MGGSVRLIYGNCKVEGLGFGGFCKVRERKDYRGLYRVVL